MNDSFVDAILEKPQSKHISHHNNVLSKPPIHYHVYDCSKIMPFSNTVYRVSIHCIYYCLYGLVVRGAYIHLTFIQMHLYQNKTNEYFDLCKKVVLLRVFSCLSSVELLRCRMVCKEWRELSSHPQLWSRIRFADCKMAPQVCSLTPTSLYYAALICINVINAF